MMSWPEESLHVAYPLTTLGYMRYNNNRMIMKLGNQ